MKFFICLLVLIGLAFSQPSTCSVSSIDNEGFLNIKSCGASESNTNNFNNLMWALNVVNNTSAKGVFIPKGFYKITVTEPIFVGAGKVLKGVQNYAHGADYYSLSNGSTLIVTPTGVMATVSGLILLAADAVLDGMNIHYATQNNVDDIKTYPATIVMGHSTRVSNTTLTNAYFGIHAMGHSAGPIGSSTSDHIIENVNMTALSRGIVVDHSASVGRIENVNIHAQYWWYSYNLLNSSPTTTMTELQKNKTIRYTLEHLYGFLFYWTDWEYISNSFVIYAQVGFYFGTATWAEAGKQYGYIGTVAVQVNPSAKIVNSGVDLSYLATVIDATNSGIGIKFDNSILVGRNVINGNNYGPLAFNNCTFNMGWIEGAISETMIQQLRGSPLITKYGPGSLQISNSQIMMWANNQESVPAIDLYGGATIISGTTFTPSMYPVSNPSSINRTFIHVKTNTGAEANVIGCMFLDKNLNLTGNNITTAGNQMVTLTTDHNPPNP